MFSLINNEVLSNALKLGKKLIIDVFVFKDLKSTGKGVVSNP